MFSFSTKLKGQYRNEILFFLRILRPQIQPYMTSESDGFGLMERCDADKVGDVNATAIDANRLHGFMSLVWNDDSLTR